jgi:hypothetical protein
MTVTSLMIVGEGCAASDDQAVPAPGISFQVLSDAFT